MDVKVGRTAVYISVFVGMRLAELYGLNIQVAGRQAGDRQKWRIRARPASIICLPRLVAFSVCRERQKPRPQKKHPRQSRKYGRKSGGGDGGVGGSSLPLGVGLPEEEILLQPADRPAELHLVWISA